LGSIFAGTLIVGGVLLSQGQMREQAKHAEAIRQKALELQATEQQSVLASQRPRIGIFPVVFRSLILEMS